MIDLMRDRALFPTGMIRPLSNLRINTARPGTALRKAAAAAAASAPVRNGIAARDAAARKARILADQHREHTVRLTRRVFTGHEDTRVRDYVTKNVTDASDYVAKNVTDATRRTITGRQDIRVRDFVQMPRVVRRMDKYSFTLGVLGICTWFTATAYLLVTTQLRWRDARRDARNSRKVPAPAGHANLRSISLASAIVIDLLSLLLKAFTLRARHLLVFMVGTGDQLMACGWVAWRGRGLFHQETLVEQQLLEGAHSAQPASHRLCRFASLPCF